MVQLFENFRDKRYFMFRGQNCYEWKLLPKAGRSEYIKSYSPTFTEQEIFNSWKRYAIQYLNIEPKNEMDWYALAQHHGLATRLLDWTKNPLTALYFSVNDYFDEDAAVFIIRQKKALIFDNIDNFNPFSIEGVRIIYPKSISPRIVSQRGIFTISNTPHVPLEESSENLDVIKVKVMRNCKRDILDTLDFYGINQMSIFHDLDNLSSYLNGFAKYISR